MDRCEHGGHPSVSCGWFADRQRHTRLLGVAIALLWGSALSRESLTQDSRSAVKARPLRSVTRIIRRGALRSSRRWRNGLPEAITWFGALDHATGCRVDAETVPMRAYVTGGASNDARTSAMRARYGLTPRRVTSSGLATHERREGLRAARTARWRRSPGRAQGDGGRRLRFSAGATA